MIRCSEPFLLSARGSTRASAYQFGNKSVTVAGKTHVVWLDAVAKVRGKTYDHGTRSWGPTVELFDGCDNHTSPALVADADGRLRLAWGPHGWWGGWNYGRFNHAVSEAPGSLESLRKREPSSFGYNATYASLVALPDGMDAIVYRGGESPLSLLFQKQRPEGGWTTARPLMAQQIGPQYTHYGGQLTCSGDGTLYVSAHFYNAETDNRSLGVAVLTSRDLGESWTDLRGAPARLPIGPEACAAVPNPTRDSRAMGLVTDSRGELWVGTYDPSPVASPAVVSRWTGAGWESTDLSRFIPAGTTIVYGALTVDTRDRLHVAATVLPLAASISADEAWGHPSLEVVHLVSTDRGRSYSCRQVSRSDGKLASWLPSISLPGLHNPVTNPVILYTHGVPGVGCSPPDETEVWCVMVDTGG